MKRRCTPFLLSALLALLPLSAETYEIDKVHSVVSFEIRHLLTKVRGGFSDFEGLIRFDPDKPEASSVNVSIQAASIDTNHDKRDEDLRSDSFFEVETYPEITFESSAVIKTGDNAYDIKGTFRMHGVSKEITLPVGFLGAITDNRGNHKVGFEASVSLDRKHYGIVWNRALDGGGLVLGDDVDISINIQATKIDEAGAAPPAEQNDGRRRPGRFARGPGGPGGFFERFDANEDGKIAKDELPERMQERFPMMDADNDGFIDQEEMQEMRRRFSGRAGSRAGPPE